MENTIKMFNSLLTFAGKSWTINAAHPNVFARAIWSEDQDKNSEVQIVNHAARLPMTDGDRYIMFDGRWDWQPVFTHWGMITKVVSKEADNWLEQRAAYLSPEDAPFKERKKYVHTVSIQAASGSNKGTGLNDARYSLLSVKDYAFPSQSYASAYKQIPSDDFITLTTKRTFLSRSAFALLMNALPGDTRLDLAVRVLKAQYSRSTIGVDFIKSVDIIRDYVERKILSQGELLVATDNIMKEKFSQVMPVNEIGFYTQGEGSPKLISKQAGRFRKLLAIGGEAGFWNMLDRQLSNNLEVEEEFHEIFEKQHWPIDIRL